MIKYAFNTLKVLNKTPYQTNYLRCLYHFDRNLYSSQIAQNQSSLQSYLVSQIKMKGPITVADFMKGKFTI